MRFLGDSELAHDPVVLAMTVHTQQLGILSLLGLLMLVGWSAIALALGSRDGAFRAVGGTVSKRGGNTTVIVVGGPYASAAIVVQDPTEISPGAGHAASTPGEVPGALPATDHPAAPDDVSALLAEPDLIADSTIASGSAVFDGSVVLDGSVVFDGSVVLDGSVVMEADRILADAAALEELWRLPAVTAEQRQTVGKQA